jgi:hypothetical protein
MISDWSKIYVGVIACLLLIMIFALIWSLIFLFQRNLGTIRGTLRGKLGSSGLNGPLRSNGPSSSKRHHGNHKKQYTLLGDEEIELEIKG